MLVQDVLDQILESRMLDVAIDERSQFLEQLIRRNPAVGDQVEEIESIARVVFGGAANTQDLDLHAVPEM